MASKNKKQSLADKISNLINVAPTNFNPDNDDENEETKAKVVDEFDEFESDDNDDYIVRNSSIRKKNVDLLDQIDDRYRGKKVNRKDIYGTESDVSEDDDDDDDDNDDDDNDDEDTEEDEVDACDDDNDDEGISESVAEESDEEESDDENEEDESDEFDTDDDDNKIDDENPLYRNRTKNKPFENISIKNPHDEIEKGNCVREQLKIWENLLEMRIQLQKCLIASNKLPQYDVHKQYEMDPDFMNSKNQTKNKLMDLLENMLQIQNQLLKNNPETKKLTDKSQNKDNSDSKLGENDSMDEEICSDTDEEIEKNHENTEEHSPENIESDEPASKKRKTLEEYEKILNENHKKYIPYRNSVIQTWNDRTRVASGNIGKGTTNQSVLKQIEFILNDKWKIIRKTQLKRSDYEIIGKKIKSDANESDNRKNHEYDPEIYDDDDFYHQLLRELIQHKSADVTDPIQLSRQWAQLQNMRNKMKRKVNTKETKGRRIRYGQIHNKLVNFMAPIEIDDVWSPIAKTELYNSLFGKFESLENNTIDKDVINDDTIIINK